MIHYGSAAMKNAVLVRSEKLIVVTVFTKFGSPSDVKKKRAQNCGMHGCVDSK